MAPRPIARGASLALALGAVVGAVLGAPGAGAAAPRPAPFVCHVRLGEIRDLRPDPEVLGDLGGKTIKAGDTRQQLRDALAGVATRAIVFAAPGAPADLEMRVDIVKAYIYALTMAKTGAVALRVTFVRDGAVVGEHIYRGGSETVNWASGQGEARGAVRMAMEDAVRQIGPDLFQACRPPSQD